jgi:hypothetical protein
MEYEVNGTKFKWWNEASRRARKKRTKNFQSDLFKDGNEKLLCGSTSFMRTCKIRLKEILQGSYFNNCFPREMTELIFYIICNGSSIGGMGKSRYSEDQIKCKVKKKLIKDVSPINWEIDEWLVYWVNFYSSFIAIYYTHMKYRESKTEEVKKGIWYITNVRKGNIKVYLGQKKKKRKRLVENILEKYDQLL